MTTPSEADNSRVRLTILFVVAACLFGALFARLAFLQVVNAPAAQKTATVNGVRQIFTQAPRGEILDTNGQVLVGNRTSEVIEVQRQEAANDPAEVTRLAVLLSMTTASVQSALKNSQYSPFAPVPLLTDATPSEILYVQEHQADFPGVQATTETLRAYSAAGIASANIVGYVGAISQAEYAKVNHNIYQPGFQVGLTGIEAEYESVLRGTPGVETLQVNAQGEVLGVQSTTPPIPGDNLKLTIDGTIQQAAEQAIIQGHVAARGTYDPVTHENFKSPAGAVVVEDPQNGTVLALATDPSYDPNQFVGGISEANYKALQDPANNDPLLDRTIQGQYAPGSTFKLVTATAALQHNLISASSTYDDTGQIKIGNETFHNDAGAAYGIINLTKAITVSSDIYFNNLGAEFWNDRGTLGKDALQQTAFEYGFGYRTGIPLPNEDPGYIPTPELVAQQVKQDPAVYGTDPTWYTGYSAQLAIGQYQDLVTPLQLANAYSTFANGGNRYAPRLAQDVETSTGQVVSTFQSQVKAHVTIDPDGRAAMLEGFRGVVQSPNGTAYPVFAGSQLTGMDIAGKTGTAQVTGAGKQDSSVFTSFAPASNPTYEVTALMESSGYGASVAGPVVRQVYDALYHLPPQPIASVSTSAGQT